MVVLGKMRIGIESGKKSRGSIGDPAVDFALSVCAGVDNKDVVEWSLKKKKDLRYHRGLDKGLSSSRQESHQLSEYRSRSCF